MSLNALSITHFNNATCSLISPPQICPIQGSSLLPLWQWATKDLLPEQGKVFSSTYARLGPFSQMELIADPEYHRIDALIGNYLIYTVTGDAATSVSAEILIPFLGSATLTIDGDLTNRKDLSLSLLLPDGTQYSAYLEDLSQHSQGEADLIYKSSSFLGVRPSLGKISYKLKQEGDQTHLDLSFSPNSILGTLNTWFTGKEKKFGARFSGNAKDFTVSGGVSLLEGDYQGRLSCKTPSVNSPICESVITSSAGSFADINFSITQNDQKMGKFDLAGRLKLTNDPYLEFPSFIKSDKVRTFTLTAQDQEATEIRKFLCQGNLDSPEGHNLALTCSGKRQIAGTELEVDYQVETPSNIFLGRTSNTEPSLLSSIQNQVLTIKEKSDGSIRMFQNASVHVDLASRTATIDQRIALTLGTWVKEINCNGPALNPSCTMNVVAGTLQSDGTIQQVVIAEPSSSQNLTRSSEF